MKMSANEKAGAQPQRPQASSLTRGEIVRLLCAADQEYLESLEFPSLDLDARPFEEWVRLNDLAAGTLRKDPLSWWHVSLTDVPKGLAPTEWDAILLEALALKRAYAPAVYWPAEHRIRFAAERLIPMVRQCEELADAIERRCKATPDGFVCQGFLYDLFPLLAEEAVEFLDCLSSEYSVFGRWDIAPEYRDGVSDAWRADAAAVLAICAEMETADEDSRGKPIPNLPRTTKYKRYAEYPTLVASDTPRRLRALAKALVSEGLALGVVAYDPPSPPSEASVVESPVSDIDDAESGESFDPEDVAKVRHAMAKHGPKAKARTIYDDKSVRPLRYNTFLKIRRMLLKESDAGGLDNDGSGSGSGSRPE